MVLDNNRPENDPFIVDGERIEEVESFVLFELANKHQSNKHHYAGTEKTASDWS